MSESLPLYRRAYDRLRESATTINATLGLLAMNAILGDSIAVHSNDPIAKQMEDTLPAAFLTPEITGNRPIDVGIVTAFSAVSVEAARRTSTVGEMAVTAVGGEVVSSGVDAIVGQTGWTGDVIDRGPSSAGVAIGARFFLDKIAAAETPAAKRGWKIAGGVFAGALTLGAFVVVGGDDGKMDMISHGSALFVGLAAHKIGARRKVKQQEASFCVESEMA
jgi:hypothetical protein